MAKKAKAKKPKAKKAKAKKTTARRASPRKTMAAKMNRLDNEIDKKEAKIITGDLAAGATVNRRRRKSK